jgi:Domain of Unknown Function with PDB structure (DUF3857)/Transglutaminase-like superfamily
MRQHALSFSFSASVTCCAAALLWPALAGAKEKPAPAPQWAQDAAKTPTPANVGDAPAVILFDEYLITVDAQNHAVERERSAMRILKPQGRRYTHCMAEFDSDQKLNYFHSWTIEPDGRHFQAMDTDFKDEGAGGDATMQFSDRFRILTPPGNDPGAVVTCETETQLRPYMSSEDWQVQYSIPIVNEALELALPPGGHFAESWSRFPPVKPVETADSHLRWEIKDVPALDLENLHAVPSEEALAARMSVMWGNSAVKGAANQWRAIGEWMGTLDANRTDPTPEITAKAQEIAAGSPDLYTKLSRITSFIQKNIRYFIVVKGIGGWQPHYAADIYRYRYGDCKDKTTLLISMLQAIGIHAEYLHVDSERGVIDPQAPSLIGDHMITAIELPSGENDPRLMARVKTVNGKNLLIFDPTDEETPVGLIRGELQGAYGNLADGADSQVLALPVLPPQSADLIRKGSFLLAVDGSLTGDIADSFTGLDAAYERALLKEHDTKEVRERLENGLAADLASLNFKGYEFRDEGQLDMPLGLDLHVSDSGYAHAAGPLLLLRPRVVGSDALTVPDVMEGKTREFPIEIGHPGRWRDSFDITLPPGYVVDETPDPVNEDTDFASYHATTTTKGNVLHYEREYVVKQVQIPAARAADFRKLESAILEDERAAAVLKKQ